MFKTVLISSILFLFSLQLSAQDTLLPLSINPVQRELYQHGMGLKSNHSDTIDIDLTSSPIIILDDFSGRLGFLNHEYWSDRNVYVNRSFGQNPQSIGIATFDGLDVRGYPYEFKVPTSYGNCDSLTTLPMYLSKVNAGTPDFDTLHLSFLYQPQGLNPFGNTIKDSLALFFRDVDIRLQIDTTVEYDPNGDTISITIDTTVVDFSNWNLAWSTRGENVYPFRQAVVKVDPALYKDGFQFRFISYGNQSGSVDHWHIDNIYFSAESQSVHENFEDIAFRREVGSKIRITTNSDVFQYTAMPWYHYYPTPDIFVDDNRDTVYMSSSYGTSNQVDLKYYAYNDQGQVVDSIGQTASGTILPANSFRPATLPLTGDPDHDFKFPTAGHTPNEVTWFKREYTMIKRTNPGSELIISNNVLKEYQVFGTYYAYDDGSAEAGWGIKASGGKVAYRFRVPEGISDTLTSVYIYFNPVVEDRSSELFKLSVWADQSGQPGQRIYQNSTLHSPAYPLQGVNHFVRLYFDQPVIVSGSFYIGWEKLSEEVMNIGYDVNNDARDRLYFDLGTGWKRADLGGSVSTRGAIMVRPSFRSLEDEQVGVEKPRRTLAQNQLKVYPNPAQTYITVETGNSGASFQGQIFSIDGSLVREIRFNDRTELDVSDLRPGLYLLRCIDDQTSGLSHTKFLIDR